MNLGNRAQGCEHLSGSFPVTQCLTSASTMGSMARKKPEGGIPPPGLKKGKLRSTVAAVPVTPTTRLLLYGSCTPRRNPFASKTKSRPCPSPGISIDTCKLYTIQYGIPSEAQTSTLEPSTTRAPRPSSTSAMPPFPGLIETRLTVGPTRQRPAVPTSPKRALRPSRLLSSMCSPLRGS